MRLRKNKQFNDRRWLEAPVTWRGSQPPFDLFADQLDGKQTGRSAVLWIDEEFGSQQRLLIYSIVQ